MLPYPNRGRTSVPKPKNVLDYCDEIKNEFISLLVENEKLKCIAAQKIIENENLQSQTLPLKRTAIESHNKYTKQFIISTRLQHLCREIISLLSADKKDQASRALHNTLKISDEEFAQLKQQIQAKNFQALHAPSGLLTSSNLSSAGTPTAIITNLPSTISHSGTLSAGLSSSSMLPRARSSSFLSQSNTTPIPISPTSPYPFNITRGNTYRRSAENCKVPKAEKQDNDFESRFAMMEVKQDKSQS